jgi:hypothetical protein
MVYFKGEKKKRKRKIKKGQVFKDEIELKKALRKGEVVLAIPLMFNKLAVVWVGKENPEQKEIEKVKKTYGNFDLRMIKKY